MSRSIDYWILWMIVVALAASNVWAALKVFELKEKADETIAELSEILKEPIATTVTINQTVPFSAVINPNETIRVPISTVVPIDTVVDAPVTLPIVGQIQVRVPVKTSVPVNLNLAIQLKEGIPIQGTTRLDSASVEIPLDNTPFQKLLERLQALLAELGA